MAWTRQNSVERIRRLMSSVPVGSIEVRDFARDYYPTRDVYLAEARRTRQPSIANPILSLPFNQAIVTQGVHIYANLMELNDQLSENGAETAVSQKRALQFLHLHYGACDRLIEAFELQRVDFHGGRLHAVVLTPLREAGERARVVKAIAFAAAFRDMVANNSAQFGGRYRTRVRVGIDSGPAVAVNSGKRSEPEPLFIGSPANHAAHLAMGDAEGIFLSSRVQQVLSSSDMTERSATPRRLLALDEQRLAAEAADFSTSSGARINARLQLARDEYFSEMKQRELATGEPAVFHFHHHEPPLKSIDFADHPPSNAIRMELASILADLDGFTKYIDASIATGQVAQAVSNLHVLRGEFAGTFRDDSAGRKIRFIGDSLHGVIAEGTSVATDRPKTVESALLAVGGVRSSFELCQEMLPGIEGLGVAIGVDFGWTPICRIGLRGDASVRCATSRTTCEAENRQQSCSGIETAIGEGAFDAGSTSVRRAFGYARKLPNFDYPTAVALIQGIPAPSIVRAEAQPVRAHMK